MMRMEKQSVLSAGNRMSHNFPEKIKVGPYLYNIHEVDGQWSEDHEAHGKCNTQTHNIWINTTYDSAHVLDTLLHELLHALWSQYNLKDKEEEEDVVTRLATGLVQLLLDNKHLLKFIKESLRDMEHGKT